MIGGKMVDIMKEMVMARVEKGGGQFVSVWEVNEMRLILFNSPQTGSTLALTVDQVMDGGEGAVRECIAESDAKFAAGATSAPMPARIAYR
jgi:hypothetical protein